MECVGLKVQLNTLFLSLIDFGEYLLCRSIARVGWQVFQLCGSVS